MKNEQSRDTDHIRHQIQNKDTLKKNTTQKNKKRRNTAMNVIYMRYD
jgi:hypothetical protein